MRRLSYFLMTISFVLLSLIFPNSVSHGQSEPQAAGLLMEHQENSLKSLVIPEGSKLKVRTVDGQSFKGELQAVTDSALNLGSEEIRFSQVKKVKMTKGKGGMIAGFTGIAIGGIMLLIGAIVGIIGGYTVGNGNTGRGCTDALVGFLVLFLGIAIGGIGLPFLIIGLVSYAVGKPVGRTLRMNGKWKMKKSA